MLCIIIRELVLCFLRRTQVQHTVVTVNGSMELRLRERERDDADDVCVSNIIKFEIGLAKVMAIYPFNILNGACDRECVALSFYNLCSPHVTINSNNNILMSCLHKRNQLNVICALCKRRKCTKRR